ncbi:MAG: hypothetical protein HZA20_08980 [Nitrospirae bacterium]|nr:hypothetical protein [Nitrospirota bacterium]
MKSKFPVFPRAGVWLPVFFFIVASVFCRMALAADSLNGIYSAGGLVLQLREERPGGDARGALYIKDAAYRFRLKRKGDTLQSLALFARSDKLSPFRKINGSVGIETGDGDGRLTIEIVTGGQPMIAVLRRGIPARSYNSLASHGDSFCDNERAVLVLSDRLKGRSSDQPETEPSWLPAIGMYLTGTAVYGFEASGSLESGMQSSTVFTGEAPDYRQTATSIKVVIDNGKLVLTVRDDSIPHGYELQHGAQQKSCARVIAALTSRRPVERRRPVQTATQPPAIKEPPAPVPKPAIAKPSPQPVVKEPVTKETAPLSGPIAPKQVVENPPAAKPVAPVNNEPVAERRSRLPQDFPAYDSAEPQESIEYEEPPMEEEMEQPEEEQEMYQ